MLPESPHALRNSKDFAVIRCGQVAQKLIKTPGYEDEYNKLQSNVKALEQRFYTSEEDTLLEAIIEGKTGLACLTDEACYRQGFRDAIYLMAGMPLE